jgi:hypothetical protein
MAKLRRALPGCDIETDSTTRRPRVLTDF